MEYLKKKYAGIDRVSLNLVKDELLLSEGEFLLIKKDIRELYEIDRCPQTISFELFDSLVESYL